jgi:2-C-methyl-D-erythritol 4-phosphate cytidylyltransferase
MKIYAVIVAGGSGNRMGTELPKQFLLLEGKALLLHTAEVFLQTFPSVELIIVLPSDFLELGKELLQKNFPGNTFHFTEGGRTRFYSVQKGLQKVEGPAIVFVHDAVRCVVSSSLIQRCYTQAMEKGSAIPAVSIRDSIRMVEGNLSTVIDREKLRSIQTPQTFHSDIILSAFNQEYDPEFTDEATVVEKSGHRVALIQGEETNIKITYPVDLIIAESILQKRRQ